MSVVADARAIARAAIRGVDPARATRRVLERNRTTISVGGRRLNVDPRSSVHLVAIGKAAAAMADAAHDRLGSVAGDVLVVHRRGEAPPRRGGRVFFGGHPEPNRESVRSAEYVVRFLQGISPEDVVLFLISGGGSAIFEAPARGIPLSDLRRTARVLLGSGAPIQALNVVRRHLSRVKGGLLARENRARRWATLAISDVVGDTPWDIASGPTVPDPTSFADALRVVRKWRMEERLPARIRQHLAAGAGGAIAENPKPGDTAFRGGSFHLVATNRTALRAASVEARARGYEPRVVSSAVTGETRRVALQQARMLLRVARQRGAWAPRIALLSGGETTVTLGPGSGKGGRNQEFALAAAHAIGGVPGLCILSIGTDGVDGPTDAAGGLVTGETLARAERRRVDLQRALARHDAYRALDRLNALIRTGPTGTNVMDLHVLLAAREPQSRYGKK